MSAPKKTFGFTILLSAAFVSMSAVSDGSYTEPTVSVTDSHAMSAAKSRICETAGKPGSFLFLYRKPDGAVGVGILNGTGSNSETAVATVSSGAVAITMPDGTVETSDGPKCFPK